jgi:WD40 repeat protein
MAAPPLTHRHMFGLKADVKNNIHFLEEGVILYPVGHTVVIHNLDTKVQRFIQGSHGSASVGKPPEITALAVSPNKRFVAIGEKGAEKATCTIYDIRTLKKKKTLITDDTQYNCREFISLCFGSDSKTLLTQGGAPYWVLINWAWTKQKATHVTTIQVKSTLLYQCSYCPKDDSLVCVTGKQMLLFFRIDQNEAKMRPIETILLEHEPEDYLCHAWADQKQCIVGSKEGSLLYMDNTMFRAKLNPASLNGRFISCITSLSNNNGFVVGCDDGMVLVFEKDMKEHFRLSRQLNVAAEQNMNMPSGKIKNIAISPSNEYMVLTLSNCQMYMIKLFEGETLCGEDAKFDHIGQNHNGPITGLDTCVRKPLIITCGVDKSVRLWNYLSKTLECVEWFSEPPKSVALHPSGLYCLIGFADRLKICTILMDSIRGFKDFPKACLEVQFSHGGHLFAAVNDKMVNVYNFFTCELVGTFRGYSAQIRSVYWSLDDTSLVASSEVGEVYEKPLNSSGSTKNSTQKITDYIQKGCKFTSVLSTEDGKVYAVGDDRSLKEIFEKALNKTVDTGVNLTQLVVSSPPHRMMFASTANGVVRSYKFPLTGDKKDYQAHHKEVTRLRISPDDAFLFSVSLDGSLAVFDIQEKDGRVPKRERPDAVPFSEEVLVTRSDLEDKNLLMTELKGKVDELTTTNEYQLKVHDMNYQDKLKEVSDKYTMQIEHDKLKIEALREEKDELKLEFEEKVNNLKTQYASELHIADLEYQKKIMAEVKKYQALQELLAESERDYSRQARDREVNHREAKNQLRLREDAKLNAENSKYGDVMKTKLEVSKKFKETVDQMLHDTDKEIEGLKEKYQKLTTKGQDHTLRLQGENGIMRKKFETLKRKIEDQQETLKSYKDKYDLKQAQIATLNQKKAELKQVTTDHDHTISAKEQEINDLKKDNQELEKYKFVLDFQIKELKSKIQPREKSIGIMKKQVTKMDVDLETYHKDNGKLQADVDELNAHVKRKQRQIKNERQSYRKALNQLTKMKKDLHHIVQSIQNPPVLHDSIELMYRKHVTEAIESVEVNIITRILGCHLDKCIMHMIWY